VKAKITANTRQPLPRTSSRLRRRARKPRGRSSTTTGAATDQAVRRKRPGISKIIVLARTPKTTPAGVTLNANRCPSTVAMMRTVMKRDSSVSRT
jgi:hypothetical protein